MDPAIKAKWVAALRSGEYKQELGQLRSPAGFCCLGVLCNLHAQAHPKIAAQQTRKSAYMGDSYSLPPPVAKWARLSSPLGHEKILIGNSVVSLAEHNDEGRSFKQIADAIEAQL